jgi:hypothetical protein
LFQLANAYQELGKELGSEKLKVVGSYTLGRVIGEGEFSCFKSGSLMLTNVLFSSQVLMAQYI